MPRDRLFIDCNLKSYNTVMTTSWPPNIQQQTMIRASVKLDFAWGVALRMAGAINATFLAAKETELRDTAEMLTKFFS